LGDGNNGNKLGKNAYEDAYGKTAIFSLAFSPEEPQGSLWGTRLEPPSTAHLQGGAQAAWQVQPTDGNQKITQKMQLSCLCIHQGDEFPSSVGTSSPKTQVMAKVCTIEK